MARKPAAERDEIRRNRDHSLDEVVVANCTFHLEQMDKRAWWIGLSKGPKRTEELHIWIRATKKGVLVVEVTEDGLDCTDVVTDLADPDPSWP